MDASESKNYGVESGWWSLGAAGQDDAGWQAWPDGAHH